MLSRISFHVLIRQMVNTRTDTDLSTAVQNALQAMLLQIREEIREEFHTGSGSSNAGGTLGFFNYALMIRQDYDITSSLRRGALHYAIINMKM
nr:hypothetical protein [Tanacetum cinerariifolium]